MAYCVNCGKEISNEALACPGCGHPGPGRVGARMESALHRTEGFAIASLACAVAAFFGIPLVGSILGIVFGNMARRRLAENPALEGENLARAGIIVGWVGVGIAAVILIVILAALGAAGFAV